VSAGLASGLFMVHPLRVEVVAWASGQPYLPCSLFSMLAVIAYLCANDRGIRASLTWLTVSFLFFVAALLSHAVAVSLPVVLLILDVYLPFMVTSLLFMGIAIAARRQALALAEQNSLSASLAQASYGTWFYLTQTVLPLNLSAVYPVPEQIDWRLPMFALPILGTFMLTLALVALRRRRPGLLASWLIYLVVLAPNSGVIRINDQIAADRYSYIAMIPLVPVLAGSICLLRAQRTNVSVLVCGAIMVSVLLIQTRGQCRTWKTGETLWTHAMNHGGGRSSLVHNNLGVEFARQGKNEAAVAQYMDALRLDPGYANPRNGLGTIFLESGKPELALAQFAEALRLRPGYAAAHNNMAVVLTRRGRFREAEDHLTDALRVNPAHMSAHNNLGVALASQGQFASAQREFEEALRACSLEESTVPQHARGCLCGSRRL
jgi:Tfp pilus assembly protein PilF